MKVATTELIAELPVKRRAVPMIQIPERPSG